MIWRNLPIVVGALIAVTWIALTLLFGWGWWGWWYGQ